MTSPPDKATAASPTCTDTRGAPVVDAIFAVLSLASIAVDQDAGAIAADVIGALVFGASMGTGLHWASACEQQRTDWETNHQREIAELTSAQDRKPERATAPTEPRIVYGDRALYCSADGGCAFDACDGCEQRTSAGCYNATRALDGVHLTVCAVDMKTCETRRARDAADPDFLRVTARCGVYRVREHVVPADAGGDADPLRRPDDL